MGSDSLPHFFPVRILDMSKNTDFHFCLVVLSSFLQPLASGFHLLLLGPLQFLWTRHCFSVFFSGNRRHTGPPASSTSTYVHFLFIFLKKEPPLTASSMNREQ